MIRQKLTKTITEAYTTTDADNGYRVICNSATPFEITLHTATGRYNFELEIDNVGAGAVTCSSQTIAQYSHAHIGNNGGTDWVVVIGGGEETDPVFIASDAAGIDSDDITNWDTAYDHSQSAHAPSDAQKNSDILKSEIEAVVTGEISSHYHRTQPQQWKDYPDSPEGAKTYPYQSIIDDGNEVRLAVTDKELYTGESVFCNYYWWYINNGVWAADGGGTDDFLYQWVSVTAASNFDIYTTSAKETLAFEHCDNYHVSTKTEIAANMPKMKPLVNGNTTNPEVVFDIDGDIIMVEVA
jgi:hypothetical protein